METAGEGNRVVAKPDVMNKEFRVPPANKASLTPPDVLAERLKGLIGADLRLSGKSRTDGANARKLVANTLEQYPLPSASLEGDYAIVPPKGKGIPSILREYVDTYIVTTGASYNLQVWNRNPTADSVQIEYTNGDQLSARDVRFVFVRVDPITHKIRAVLVLTPDYIEKTFGRFGVPTIKHQLIITAAARAAILASTPPVLFYADTPTAAGVVTNAYVSPRGSIHDEPAVGHLLASAVLRDAIVPHVLGTRLDAAPTKNRGQALESLVAHHLSYRPTNRELLAGGYPDIRNQALEIKVQDSPTVDLGQFSPQFKVDVPGSPGLTTEDIRYFIALTDATTGVVKGLVLCPGFHLGAHFSYVSNTSYKCQRSIPMSFFGAYDEQAVFNPG